MHTRSAKATGVDSAESLVKAVEIGQERGAEPGLAELAHEMLFKGPDFDVYVVPQNAVQDRLKYS